MERVSLVWFLMELSMAVRSEVRVSVVRVRESGFWIEVVRALRAGVNAQLAHRNIEGLNWAYPAVCIYFLVSWLIGRTW